MSQLQTSCIYAVQAIYLGNEPMGELLEGENGSDVIQAPLKRTILRTNGSGRECELSITNDSLLITFLNNKNSNNNTFSLNQTSTNTNIRLPIDMLAYCGALRQIPYDQNREREFETLDKAPLDESKTDPPLFVTIFRSIEKENTLYCHSFVIGRDEEAMELVKLVMEIYYNLIRLQELDENSNSNQNSSDIILNNNNNTDVLNETINSKNNTTNSKLEYKKSFNQEAKELLSSFSNKINKSKLNDTINILEKTSLNDLNDLNDKQTNNQYLNDLLNQYNKTPVLNNNGQQETVNDILPYIQFSSNQNKETKGESNDNVDNNYESIEKEIEVEMEEINSNGAAKLDNNRLETISASDLLKQNLDLENFKLINAEDIKSGKLDLSKFGELNDDKDPIIIKKENNEQIMYKQNVFIRWLQPPTPPPPAPIIIREVQEPSKEPAPLVIYKQAPRPATPPPLVIRERPPTPLEQPMEPLIIEKRVSAPEKPRKIIIEHLPAPPPKPRDIILEKWIPKEAPPRSVIYQPVTSNYPIRQVYEVIDTDKLKHSSSQNSQIKSSRTRDIYELFNEKQSPLNHYHQIDSSKQQPSYSNKRSNSNDIIYNQPSKPVQTSSILFSSKGANEAAPRRNLFNVNELYHQQNTTPTSSNKNKSRVAGYRIIRQIIPGPNSTDADIERAIARSQYVNTSSYVPVRPQPAPPASAPIHHIQRKVYSPYSDYNNGLNMGSAAPSAPHPLQLDFKYKGLINGGYQYKSMQYSAPIGLVQAGHLAASYRPIPNLIGSSIPVYPHPLYNTSRYVSPPRKVSDLFRSCSFENY